VTVDFAKAETLLQQASDWVQRLAKEGCNPVPPQGCTRNKLPPIK